MATNDELYELKHLYGIGRSLGATLINQHGHDANTIGEWLAEGFTTDQIMEWPWRTEVTKAKEYLDNGFTVSDYSVIAQQLGRVHATKVADWRSAGFTLEETWMGWKAYSKKLEHHRYYKHYNPDSDFTVKEFNHLDAIKEAQEYVDAGFIVREYYGAIASDAVSTAQPVPDCEEVVRWTQYGIPLGWVVKCVTMGADIALCKEWADLSQDRHHNDAMSWIELGVSPDGAKEWLDMGHDLNAYRRASQSFSGQYHVLFRPLIESAYENIWRSMSEVIEVFDSEDFNSAEVFAHLGTAKTNLLLFAEHVKDAMDHFKNLIENKEQEGDNQCLEQSVLF